MKLKSFTISVFISFICFLSGDNTSIRNIDIKGNDNISDQVLLFILRQKSPNIFFRRPNFNPRLLKLDALTIKNYYHSKGFLDVNVIDIFEETNGSVDIVFKIIEGKQYFLSEIKISGNQLVSDKKIKQVLGLFEDHPYNPVGVNDNIYQLENLYHNMSKLFFSIKVKDNISDSVSVNIIIEEGKNVSIKNVYLEKIGNIDSSLVNREILFKSGNFYSKNIVDKTSKRLREMGVFSTVNIIPVKVVDSDSLVNLVLDFRRYKQREWNSSGGYDPISFSEGAPELPALSGTIEWRNRSFFNTPKQFSTKLLAGIPVSADFLTPRIRYDVSLSGNWFFNIRFPTTVTAYYESFILYDANKYDGDINRFGADLSQRVDFKDRSFGQIKAVWESFSDNELNLLEEKTVSFKLNIDKKDKPLYTTEGYLFLGVFKFAGFGGERNYQKIDLTNQVYFPILKNSTFAIRVQTGKIWGWDNRNSDYSYEKFYLGGSTSMRAWDVLRFKENDNSPAGKTIRIMSNVELRSFFYKDYGFTIFSDGGLLEDNFSNISFDNMKWDAGLGLTVKTPLGPARLDYAFQINNEGRRKIQLGVQSLF